MIHEVEELNKEDYYLLGKELNDNFIKMYNIDTVLMQNYNEIYGYFLDNKLIGFIHIIISFDEADIVNIIVNKDYRNLGIGSKLIDYCIEKHDLKALNLEVKENNPAVSFYEKKGFKIMRKIPNYYKDCDAYFMKKRIGDINE